jgi:hypothetical protein
MFRMYFIAPKMNIVAIIPPNREAMNIRQSYPVFQYGMLNLFKSEGCGACGK